MRILGAILLISFLSQGADRQVTPKNDARKAAFRQLLETPVDTSYKEYEGSLPVGNYSLTINTSHALTHLEDVSELTRCTVCILENVQPETDTLDITGLCNVMPHLTALYMHNIPITRLALPAENSHKALKHLEITNTALTELPCAAILTAFPQLRSIFVKNNSTLKRMTYPLCYSKLREVDLQDNACEDIDLNQLLALSTKLNYINLSGNPIKRIDWQPDIFAARDKAPELILKRVTCDADTRAQLCNGSSEYSAGYLWMKKFVPSAAVLTSSMYSFFTTYGDWKVKLLWYGIGGSVGYCVGHVVVDTILFPGTEKKFVYFVPIFDE